MTTNQINMQEIAKAINAATANVRLDPSLENVTVLRRTCNDANMRCDRMHRDYAHVDCAIRAAKNAMENLGRALFTSASDVDYTP